MVLLVRHAEKAYSNAPVPAAERAADYRQYDAPLTPRGVAQARAAGEALRAHVPAAPRAVSSPFARCRETAAAFLLGAGVSSAAVQIDARLGEFLGNQGRHLPSHARACAAALRARLRPDTLALLGDAAALPRETREAYHARVVAALDELRAAAPDAVVFTHGLAIERATQAFAHTILQTDPLCVLLH